MKVGIRREDKNKWEARVPLIPSDVKRLIDSGIEVVLQPSSIRIFPDQDFSNVGARIAEDLSDCSLIIAVKEIPIDFIQSGKSYLFFSHTVKGQDYNMPLLRKMMVKQTQLFDYERIVNEKGQRLIFFGRHAGLAGMIDSLWAFGQRLKQEGIETPFSKIKNTHEYDGLQDAKDELNKIAKEILETGTPKEISPIICGFTGYGNVSQGAQEIFDIFPNKQITPEQLLLDKDLFSDSKHSLYKVVFKESDLFEPNDTDSRFDLQDYYDNPLKYKSKFEQYLPKLSILMNCIYWDTDCPRLVTKEYLKRAWAKTNNQKLKVIGDISCDIDGSIECTAKSTESGNPVYVYNPITGEVIDGIKGDGPVIMAVDNLPCELPTEASKAFSKILVNFVPQLAKASYNIPFDKLDLPPELRRAMILHQGELTEDYKYLEENLKSVY